MALPTEDEIYAIFKKFGLSKTYHFIIPHSSKLPNLSQIVRSLRPYVDTMFIVQGMENGRHYHAIAHFKPKVEVPTFTKFRLKKKPLVSVIRDFNLDDVQAAEKAKHYNQLREVRNLFKLIPEDAQYTCAMISCMIKQHFAVKQKAEKATETKLKKRFHISGVYNYLIKNLNENQIQTEYHEYQLINFNSKKNLSVGIPLTSCIP